MAICTLKREASGDTNMANSLILDFPPPEMWENKFMSCNPPNLWDFVMEP
jgi:hypothetical protein